MKIGGWLKTEIFKVIGWSIIHSLWQFLILFAALKVLLLLINRKNSNLRYYISLMILSAAIICSIFTFWYEYNLFFGNEPPSFTTNTYPVKASPETKANFNAMTDSTTIAMGHILPNFFNIISPYLTFGWIIGMLLYLIRIVNGSFYLNSLRKLQTELNQEIDKKMAALKDKMQIGKEIKLIITNAINEPLTFGWLKPVILLPCSYITRVPMEQWEMIL